ALLAGCGDPPGAPPASSGATADRPVPASIANLTFTTSGGARISLSDLRGKVVVLADFLALCGEECPMTSANMNLMARAVSQDGQAGQVAFVEFTVDPARDTPARLAAYRKLYGPASDWILMTTTPSNLKAFARYFGIFYEKTKEGNPPDIDWLTHKPLTYDIAHQDAVLFLDKQGHERVALLGQADTHGQAPPPALGKFLDAEGRKNLTDPGPLSWTVPQGLQVVSWLLGKEVTT
ncbi:MAG: SCO family protein, partial [Trebonia sp.]